MTPKGLKTPFCWEERRPMIEDSVFYVPNYYFLYDKFLFPGWDSPEVFGNDHPVFVEFCSGNGDWIIAKALENPKRNWVAVEKRFDRVRKIWSKAKNLKVNNLFIVCGEGLTFTKHYIVDQSVDAVFVNFPDPWPKDKHAKHRIIQEPFVQQAHRILKMEGTLTLVTDDADYSEQMIEKVLQHPGFRASFPKPYYSREMEGYGNSWFEKFWRQMGREIRFMEYKRACIDGK